MVFFTALEFLHSYTNFYEITSASLLLVQTIRDPFFTFSFSSTHYFRSQKSPVYLYLFTHEATRSNSELFGFAAGAAAEDFGSAHADDLILLFNDPSGLNGSATAPADIQARDVITSLWSNFASTGHPTPPQQQQAYPNPGYGHPPPAPYGYPPQRPPYPSQSPSYNQPQAKLPDWAPFQVKTMFIFPQRHRFK